MISPDTGSFLPGDALAKVLPVWPEEIADTSRAGRLALLARLRRALREERRRGRAGHWSYDLARHAALLAAYRAETRRQLAAARSTSDAS